MRAWSFVAAEEGRIPGVTTRKSGPHACRRAEISRAEATTPSSPALCAKRASRITASTGVPEMPNSLQVPAFEAGQDRHRQHPWASFIPYCDPGGAHPFERRFHHLPSARGVDVHHADAKFRSFPRRRPHRVRDVVEFKVEENPLASGYEVTDRHGAFGGEKFRAHLEHSCMAMQPFRHSSCSSRRSADQAPR